MSYSLVRNHLYDGNREQFLIDLLSSYAKKRTAIVNFLYFANVTKYRLLEKHRNVEEITYKQALLAGDFLLPDGIALQTYRRSVDRTWMSNLNGTDMMPYILDKLSSHYSVSLYVYGAYDSRIQKDPSRLEKGLDALLLEYPQLRIAHSYQSDYLSRGEDFPFEKFASTVEKDSAEIKLFLNCTGTPFQEQWVDHYRQRFNENNMMVFNVGGFLDFISGYEKRAPDRAVKARVLETPYRIITNPKKNFKKFVAMFGVFRLLRKRLVKFLKSLLSKK